MAEPDDLDPLDGGPGLPDRFLGVWRRQGLTVGGVPRDDAEVIWLQGRRWYADLRIPHVDDGGPVEAFAGPATWDEPHFTWHHELDWKGSFPADVGHLASAGDDLIETGTFEVDGADVPYHERWVQAGAGAPRLVAVGGRPEGGRACVVRVGEHCLSFAAGASGQGFAVRRDDLVDDAWELCFARHDGLAALVPPPLAEAWAPGDRLVSGGWDLTVVDVA